MPRSSAGGVAMFEPEQRPAPQAGTGMNRMLREFWFQVGVAVTATLIAALALTVVPRLMDSGAKIQTVQNASAAETTSAPAGATPTVAGQAPGAEGASTTAAAGIASIATAPGATTTTIGTAVVQTAPAATSAATTAAPAKPATTAAPAAKQ